MGLLDRFGAGGGKLTFELPSTTTRCGDSFKGTAVFTAGKREQQITGMQVWFVKITDKGETPVWEPTKITVADTIKPGEVKRYPFDVVVPKIAQLKINGQIVREKYGLRASLDIPKEIDPQAKNDDLVIDGGIEAEVTTH